MKKFLLYRYAKYLKMLFIVFVICALVYIVKLHNGGVYIYNIPKALNNKNNIVLIYSQETGGYYYYYYILRDNRIMECYVGYNERDDTNKHKISDAFNFIYEGKRKLISKSQYKEILNLANSMNENLSDIECNSYMNQQTKDYFSYKGKIYSWAELIEEMRWYSNSNKLKKGVDEVEDDVENLKLKFTQNGPTHLKHRQTYIIRWKWDYEKCKYILSNGLWQTDATLVLFP